MMLRGREASNTVCTFLESFLHRGDQDGLWQLSAALEVLFDLGQEDDGVYYETYMRTFLEHIMLQVCNLSQVVLAMPRLLAITAA